MKKIIFWILIFNSSIFFAQNEFKHKVAKGETVTQIAKKYAITPLDIFKLNPDARAGISENTVLVLPKSKQVSTPVGSTKKHIVVEKETLFSISKQYGVTVNEIESLNPDAKNGLKIGQTLVIPSKGEVLKAVSPNKGLQQKLPILHTVQAKETRYGIAKQYDITIEELEKKNPEIVGKELPLGYQLLIKGERPKITAPVSQQPKPISSTSTPFDNTKNQGVYTVKPQETLYSLTKQFDCTQEELIALNPELKEGLKEGMILKVPTKSSVTVVKANYSDLTKSIKNQNKKKLALLLPFNINKLDQDTINSTKARLQKDKFLNMTLDFYSGAMMAIDSIHKLGSNIEVTILDSDETKSSSNVTNLIQQNDLKSFDAVIGPFYQNNIEKAASLLETVPIISPLSKDYDKVYPNLMQATPTNNDVKNAMFDYIRSKGGNIIAIIDPKKQSIKQFILENHKDVQFVSFTEAGAVDFAQLKTLLVTGKENYVIMETEKTNLILSITSNLLSLQKQLFDI
ncbi:MAG: LysM peptidoglycan-binding domain-containing protein, partial [Limnohabitans sp.]|nr:LysM peptidoglycan-binding domain-containing protein [Limnohabitans sp.]